MTSELDQRCLRANEPLVLHLPLHYAVLVDFHRRQPVPLRVRDPLPPGWKSDA